MRSLRLSGPSRVALLCGTFNFQDAASYQPLCRLAISACKLLTKPSGSFGCAFPGAGRVIDGNLGRANLRQAVFGLGLQIENRMFSRIRVWLTVGNELFAKFFGHLCPLAWCLDVAFDQSRRPHKPLMTSAPAGPLVPRAGSPLRFGRFPKVTVLPVMASRDKLAAQPTAFGLLSGRELPRPGNKLRRGVYREMGRLPRQTFRSAVLPAGGSVGQVPRRLGIPVAGRAERDGRRGIVAWRSAVLVGALAFDSFVPNPCIARP